MKELRIGVIGTGGRGELAFHAHEPDNGVRIVAGADVYPPGFKRFHERAGDDAFTTGDYRELLKRDDVDAVFVCTPDYCHEEHAVAALESGKPVYLEKPIAITMDGADRVLKTAYETGSKLFLGHNMRYFESILKMKEVIDSGAIGDVRAAWCRHFVSYGGDAYFKDWHSERKHSTGLLLQKGAHDIDVIHWLAGAYTKQVVAMGKLDVYDKCKRRNRETRGDASFDSKHWPPEECNGFSPIIDVEDHTMLLMNLANGVQASYLQCHYTPDSSRNYTFIGTKGRVENIGDSGGARIEVLTSRDSKEPDAIYNIGQTTGGHAGSDPRIVQAFVDFVRDDTQPNTSPVAARYSVAAGIMGTDSLRDGCTPRMVPDLDPKLIEYFDNGQK